MFLQTHLASPWRLMSRSCVRECLTGLMRKQTLCIASWQQAGAQRGFVLLSSTGVSINSSSPNKVVLLLVLLLQTHAVGVQLLPADALLVLARMVQDSVAYFCVRVSLY